MSKLEYLALPYTHKDKKIMDFRAKVSDFIFAELCKEGRVVYAPISSCHHIAITHGLPTHYKFWKEVCETFVRASYKLIIVLLPEWEKSVGLMAELTLAQKLGLEIEWLNPEPYLERLGYES